MARSSRTIAQIIEEQILRWRAEQKMAESKPPPPRRAPAALTIAHAFGSHGAEIAQKVAANLELPLFDREILEHIAKSAKVRVETVETLDEKASGSVDEYLSSLMRERGFHRTDYLRHLAEVVLAIWQHGPCVMVGHGCVHMVPRDHCVAIRLDAPASIRAEAVAARDGVAIEIAKKTISQVDAERGRFHKTNFGKDPHDPMCYDLMLDTSRFGVEDSIAIVTQAYRLRFKEAVGSGRRAA